MGKLTSLDRDCKYSFIELLNKNKPFKSNPLPTYIIIPMEDKSGGSNKIKNHYGYVEYLEHAPNFNLDIDHISAQVLSAMPIETRFHHKNVVQNIVDEEIKKRLRAFVNDKKKSDYVIKGDPSEIKKAVKKISRQLGHYMAFMLATGILDSHNENLIFHKLLAFLIDTEIALGNIIYDPVSGLDNFFVCLNSQQGSMIPHTVTTKEAVCLIDIMGMRKTEEILIAEKNRIYHCDETQKELKLLVPKWHGKSIIKGFKECVATMEKDKGHENHFSQWFDNSMVKTMPIRVITLETGRLEELLKTTQKFDFSPKEFQRLMEDQKNKAFNPEYPPPPVNCVAYFPDNSENILKEFRLFSIPAFYAFANKKFVYDSYGKKLVIRPATPLNAHQRQQFDKVLSRQPPHPKNPTDYFSEPPIELAKKSFECLLNNDKIPYHRGQPKRYDPTVGRNVGINESNVPIQEVITTEIRKDLDKANNNIDSPELCSIDLREPKCLILVPSTRKAKCQIEIQQSRRQLAVLIIGIVPAARLFVFNALYHKLKQQKGDFKILRSKNILMVSFEKNINLLQLESLRKLIKTECDNLIDIKPVVKRVDKISANNIFKTTTSTRTVDKDKEPDTTGAHRTTK